MKERKHFSSRSVLLGFALSLVFALAGAYWIYTRYVHFEPVAALHVPADSELVVQLQVEQAVIYEPFRRHILPLLELGKAGPESRLKALERWTTLELGVDTREWVLAWDTEGEWVMALGGLFRKDKILEGVRGMLQEEGLEVQPFEDPPRLQGAEGRSWGQASDGTFLLAQTEELFRQVWKPRPAAVQPFRVERGSLGALHVQREEGFLVSGEKRIRSVEVQLRPGRDFSYEARFSVLGEGWEDPLAVLSSSQEEVWSWVAGQVASATVGNHSEGFSLTGELTREQFEAWMLLLRTEVQSRLDK